MVYIYVIKCENDKYYVGKTTKLVSRIGDHFKNSGSQWTKRHKPVTIMNIYRDCDDYDEDKYTIKLMDKYGIDNVRGGSFAKINLTKNEMLCINRMIMHANDLCFKCGQGGHFIRNCRNNTIVDELQLMQSEILSMCNNYSSCDIIDLSTYLNILCIVDDVVFDGITIDDIKRFLDINDNSIDYKVLTHKLIGKLNDIFKPHRLNNYKKWTIEMESILLELLRSGASYDDIAIKMERSRGAIKSRVNVILQRNKETYYDTIIKKYNITNNKDIYDILIYLKKYITN